jgi:hypothetical protein
LPRICLQKLIANILPDIFFYFPLEASLGIDAKPRQHGKLGGYIERERVRVTGDISDQSEPGFTERRRSSLNENCAIENITNIGD